MGSPSMRSTQCAIDPSASIVLGAGLTVTGHLSSVLALLGREAGERGVDTFDAAFDRGDGAAFANRKGGLVMVAILPQTWENESRPTG